MTEMKTGRDYRAILRLATDVLGRKEALSMVDGLIAKVTRALLKAQDAHDVEEIESRKRMIAELLVFRDEQTRLHETMGQKEGLVSVSKVTRREHTTDMSRPTSEECDRGLARKEGGC